MPGSSREESNDPSGTCVGAGTGVGVAVGVGLGVVVGEAVGLGDAVRVAEGAADGVASVWPDLAPGTAEPQAASARLKTSSTSAAGHLRFKWIIVRGIAPSGLSEGPERLLVLAADEGFGHFAGNFVLELLGRGLHEVGRRGDQRAGQTAVEAELGAAHRVDDHARRVRRVPDL